MNGVNSIDYNEHKYWENHGSITVAEGALGPTARTQAAVLALAAANKVIVAIPDGAVAWEWRFRTDGNENDAPVLEMYAACAKGSADLAHYSRVAKLTLAQGTQLDAGSIYFCDTIAATLEGWYNTTFLKEPATPDNHISSYGLNTFGHNRFLFVASTLIVTTIYVDGRQLP